MNAVTWSKAGSKNHWNAEVLDATGGKHSLSVHLTRRAWIVHADGQQISIQANEAAAKAHAERYARETWNRTFADVVLYVTTPGDPSVGINGWHATVTITSVLADERKDVIHAAKQQLKTAFQHIFDDGPVHVMEEGECA